MSFIYRHLDKKLDSDGKIMWHFAHYGEWYDDLWWERKQTFYKFTERRNQIDLKSAKLEI